MDTQKGVGMSSSLIIRAAFDSWREVRREYQLVLEAHYRVADQATGGNLLTRDARARGVSSWSLFMGQESRAQKWASEELKYHWQSHPRVTFAAYEKGRM